MKDEKKIPVNVNIDGHIYSVKVSRNQEAYVRQAAKIAHEEITRLKENYHLPRNEDAPVLVLLKHLTRKLVSEDECRQYKEAVDRLTQEILDELDRH